MHPWIRIPNIRKGTEAAAEDSREVGVDTKMAARTLGMVRSGNKPGDGVTAARIYWAAE